MMSEEDGEAGRKPAPPDWSETSQRVDEGDELVLLGAAQVLVIVNDERCLAPMAQDRVVARERFSVMHEPVACSNSPQRWSPHRVLRCLAAILDNSITSPYVVQQEVSEGVDDFVAESGRHCECSAVYRRARGRGCNGRDVADRAADRIEYLRTLPGVVSRGEGRVSRRRLGSPHETSELVDVGEAIRSRLVLRIGCYLANRREIRRIEGIRYSHFIDISIACE